MIFGVSDRAITAAGFVDPADADDERTAAAPPADTLVALWPQLTARTSRDDVRGWTSTQWAEFLDAPLLEHPFATSHDGDRRALFHLELALGPDDRILNEGEWTYAAHTLLASLGLCGPDGDGTHRWIALLQDPRHLHLIANLIGEDGTWAPLPAPLILHMRDQVRLILDALNRPPGTRPRYRKAPSAASTRGLADLLDPLTDEPRGLLAHARHQIEKAASSAAGSPDLRHAGFHEQLEWIARRLYGIQDDLSNLTLALARHQGRRAPARGPAPGQSAAAPAQRVPRAPR